MTPTVSTQSPEPVNHVMSSPTYAVFAAWPERPLGPITPTTEDYWQVRRWAARFLRAARQAGATVRPYRVWEDDLREPVEPNRWIVRDGDRRETWSIRKTGGAA